MAGTSALNNLVSDTQTTSTTMPAWYDQAQQDIMSQGKTALNTAPTFSQTTGQNAVNILSGADNPFTQSQSSLNKIASGAANPWITDASGNITPDKSTAMGGLFSAQRDELNQLMPEYSAAAEAGGIGSGNFGSLRGQTAVQKARGDAFSKLNAAQLQAALTNQQTGATAAKYLSDVGSQGINANMNVGIEQMNSPYRNVSNYANLLNSTQVPTKTTSQVQYSPLSLLTSLGTAGKGALDSLTSLYGTAAGKNLLDKIGIGSWFDKSVDNGTGNADAGTGNDGTVGGDGGAGGASGDYNGVDYGNTGPVLPISTDTTDNGDYNGVDYSVRP
jgi:hypothetical protein